MQGLAAPLGFPTPGLMDLEESQACQACKGQPGSVQRGASGLESSFLESSQDPTVYLGQLGLPLTPTHPAIYLHRVEDSLQRG